MQLLDNVRVTWFMNHYPQPLGSIINRLGQTVTLYEHPVRGDEVPIYIRIDNGCRICLARSDQYDTVNLLDNPAFEPLLWYGRICYAYEVGLVPPLT